VDTKVRVLSQPQGALAPVKSDRPVLPILPINSANPGARVGDRKTSIPGLGVLTRYCGMSNTSNLQLPYLAVGQAQKHVTLNQSLRRLDAIVQLGVVSATTTVQPSSPTDGDVHIVPSGKSGANWAAYANWSLAYYRDGAWEQISPREGWIAYVRDTDRVMIYSGASWADISTLLHVSATDRLLGRVSAGAGVVEQITCTAAGRALIDDADARAQCATLGTWRVLAASAVAASVTGTTTKTALATVNVPAGAMGSNGRLRVTCHFSMTTSTNTKTCSFELGGSVFMSRGEASATVAALRDQREIANRNSASSQVSWRATTIGGLGQGTNTLTTGAVDTSVSQDLVFYGQLANSTETITLENYLVELYNHA